MDKRPEIFSSWPGPVTWVLPASQSAPKWITGKFDSIAVRVANHAEVKALCAQFGKPLVSTSANLAGCDPVKDIEEAKQLPPSEIQRLEYDLKEEWNEQHITHLEERVELLESCCHILKEEVKITSAVLKDGTELESQFEALNKQLEFLQNQKPKTTVIVKEVPVKKKKK